MGNQALFLFSCLLKGIWWHLLCQRPNLWNQPMLSSPIKVLSDQPELQHLSFSQQPRIIPLSKSLNVQMCFARGQSTCLRFLPDGDGCQGNSQHHLCILSPPRSEWVPSLWVSSLCAQSYRCPLRVICLLLTVVTGQQVWFY